MDIPTAAVAISGFTVISAILFKTFKGGNNTTDEVLKSMKELLIKSNDLHAKAITTLALMEQKINGSHEKLNRVELSTLKTNLTMIEVEKHIDELKDTTKEILGKVNG